MSADAFIRVDRRRRPFLGRMVFARAGFFVPCAPGYVVREWKGAGGAAWIQIGRASEAVPRWKVTMKEPRKSR